MAKKQSSSQRKVANAMREVHNNPCFGFSGAQVGAAKNLAYRMLRDGYAATIESMRKHDSERLIQVSNEWPHAPEPAVSV